MDQRRSTIAGLIFAGVGLVIVVVAYLGHRPGAAPGQPGADGQATPQTDARGETTSTHPQSKRVTAATKGSPALADSSKSKTARTQNDPEQADNSEFDYGVTKPVKGDTNPQVKSVAEALRDKHHPERLSPLIQPKPFDKKSHKENPKAYLNTVEPGRCFQSAQPGEGVPQLRPLSPQFQNVAQGQSITLRVKVAPGAPCSFTSFDLGKFENELTAITVQADEEGVAETEFFGTPGTINEVNIQASSPTSSGRARFIVNVTK